METPQITLTVHLVGGEFKAVTAIDQNGDPYDVTLSFAPRRKDDTAQLTADHKDHSAGMGRWCCDDEGTICRWIPVAPPCPPGFHELGVEIKNE
jgi:hypothetical protein